MCLGTLEHVTSKVMGKSEQSMFLEVSPLQLTTSLQSLHQDQSVIV